MSLPPIDQAALPAAARNGTDKDKQAYTAALGFERMLVAQLTKSIAPSEDSGAEDSGAEDSGTSVYGDLVASSLADSIAQKGGLGLADSLYRSFGKDR